MRKYLYTSLSEIILKITYFKDKYQLRRYNIPRYVVCSQSSVQCTIILLYYIRNAYYCGIDNGQIEHIITF